MIALLDDHYFVAQACELRDLNSDRWLAHAIHCGLGENSDVSRLASLVVSFAFTAVLLRLFIGRQQRLAGLLGVALHPMVAFSFFYASQLSTALTILWGAVWTLLWKDVLNGKKSILKLSLGFAVSFAATLLRAEAWIYSWTIAFFWVLHQLSSTERNVDFSISRAVRGFFLGSLPAVFRPQWISFLAQVYKSDSALSSAGAVAVEVANQTEVVRWGHWLTTQSQAAWIYFQNLIIPHYHSFFGPWYRQFLNDSSAWTQWVWPVVTGLGVLSCGVWWWHFKKSGKRESILALALLSFFLPTLGLSLVPRVDWYYPSRQMLGSSLALILFVTWLAQVGSVRRLQLFLVFSASAFLLHSIWHYSSPESFRKFESWATWGSPHPFVGLEEGRELLVQGSIDEAVSEFRTVIQDLDRVGFEKDQRAGLFWTMAHYYSWLAFETRKQTDASRVSLQNLSRSSFFPSTLACLQDERVPLKQCLTKDRIANFCSYFGNRGIPPLLQIRKLRANPCHQGLPGT